MAGDASYNSVSLLLHCDGVDGSTVFLDHSPSPKAITANGNAKISTTQSQFGGASAYFDGTGDYLAIAHNAALELTGDFTIETWVRFEALPATTAIFAGKWNPSSGQSWLFGYAHSTTELMFDFRTAGNSYVTNRATVSGGLSTGVQRHIAVSRQGSSVRFFLDGVLLNTVTQAEYPQAGGMPLWIGAADASPSQLPFNGWLDDLRITKGVARYTASFTPHASAHPDGVAQVSGTVKDDTDAACVRAVRAYNRHTGALIKEAYSTAGDPAFNQVALLLHCDGTNDSTTFADSSPVSKTVTAYGNAKISTAQSKFGGASAYFDGNGDYLGVANFAGVEFGSSDFTIESWFHTQDTTVDQAIASCYNSTSPGTGWVFRYSPTSSPAGLRFVAINASGVSDIFQFAWAPSANTWYHLAVVRSGNTITLYVDGVSVGSGSLVNATTIANSGQPLYVGMQNIGGTPFSPMKGYLDEIRITKGVGRYTANFTPPTDRHPDKLTGNLGDYNLWLPSTDEVNIIVLDDDAGTLYNDKIERVIPA